MPSLRGALGRPWGDLACHLEGHLDTLLSEDLASHVSASGSPYGKSFCF